MKEKLKIDNMTCATCENRIERKLKNTNGITDAVVSYSNGTAEITYDSNAINIDTIIGIIEKLDYKASKAAASEKPDYFKLLGIGVIILAVFMLINHLGGFNIFNMFPQAKAGMGYGMLFVIGLLTSVHCVAMCGGINISQCAVKTDTDNDDKCKPSPFKQALLYNSGRVISYTVVGFIVGLIGSAIAFSGFMRGVVQVAAGVFMVIMGLNMLNIFPWLRKLNPRMPKFIAKKINRRKMKATSPLYIGLLNGLMPCGPLQAMQIYALSTGSPIKGALSMLLFSLGTFPLMFGLGALSSFLTKKFKGRMMTVSAALVLIMGIFMFTSGMSLSGISIPSVNINSGSKKATNIAVIENGVQTITTKLSSGSYEPITVQKGIPVKWTIKASDGDINGCNNEIIIPKFNKQKKLEPGDNLIEFTPSEAGKVAYSCWMGMIRSSITVVDDINSSKSGGTSEANKSDYKIPVDNIAIAAIKDGKQTVSIDLAESRFTQAVIVMQKDVDTTWIINGKTLNKSNQTLVFPKYNATLNMKQGENPIYFVPSTDFDFSNADHTFYGYVKVVDDINKIDVIAIKNEVAKYVPTVQEIEDSTGLPSCH